MPRFYLNVINSRGGAIDHDGQDLPDAFAARQEAINGIRSMLSEEAASGKIDFRGRIEVLDSGGTVVCIVPFTEAVAITAADDANR